MPMHNLQIYNDYLEFQVSKLVEAVFADNVNSAQREAARLAINEVFRRQDAETIIRSDTKDQWQYQLFFAIKYQYHMGITRPTRFEQFLSAVQAPEIGLLDGNPLRSYRSAIPDFVSVREFLESQSPKGPGAIESIGVDDLLPLARKEYDAHIQRLGVSSIPIFIDRNFPDMWSQSYLYPDPNAIPESHGELGNDDPSKSYFVISEFNHRWREEDAEKYNLYADDPIGLERHTNPEILAQLKAMSQALGIEPVPELYISRRGGGGSASLTKSGKYYITLDNRASIQEQIDILGHELGHISKGHLTAANKVRLHNLQFAATASVVDAEREADQVMIDLCRGTAFAERLQSDIQRRMSTNITPEERDWLIFEGRLDNQGRPGSDRGHPVYQERIDAVETGLRLNREAGRCEGPGSSQKSR